MIWLVLTTLSMAQDPGAAAFVGPQLPAPAPVMAPAPPQVAHPEALPQIPGSLPSTVERELTQELLTPRATTPGQPLGVADGSDEPGAWLEQLDGLDRVASSSPVPGLPWWVPLAALIGAGAFYWSRKKKAETGPEDGQPIRVASRAQIDGTAGIAIVEIRDGGRRRRFLIGTGDKSPVLLTELGATRAAATTGVEVTSAPIGARPVSRRSSGLSNALSSGEPAKRRSVASDWAAPEPGGEMAPRTAAARVLHDEALGRGPGAVQ